MAFGCCGFLALAFLCGFFVILPATKLGQNAGFLTGAFETSQRCVEMFTLFYTNARHTIPVNLSYPVLLR